MQYKSHKKANPNTSPNTNITYSWLKHEMLKALKYTMSTSILCDDISLLNNTGPQISLSNKFM
jgi:hypothetical protein